MGLRCTAGAAFDGMVSGLEVMADSWSEMPPKETVCAGVVWRKSVDDLTFGCPRAEESVETMPLTCCGFVSTLRAPG